MKYKTILLSLLAATRLFGGSLTEEEATSLQFMREEEKLARDTYLVLYEEWGLTVFENIAASEQQHTDTIESLLEQYALEDPVASEDEIGGFVDEHLAELGAQDPVEPQRGTDLIPGAAVLLGLGGREPGERIGRHRVDDELVVAFAALIPQLSSSSTPPTAEESFIGEPVKVLRKMEGYEDQYLDQAEARKRQMEEQLEKDTGGGR